MQREDARAARARGVEQCEQLLERQRAPVLVEAEVRVRVDDFRIRGAQLLDFGEKRRERAFVERLVHHTHLILSAWRGRW